MFRSRSLLFWTDKDLSQVIDLMKKGKGILCVDKPTGCTTHNLVERLRFLTGQQSICHCGTLDPFASGLVVLLISKEFTKQQTGFLMADKEYHSVLKLGVSTASYDVDGDVTAESDFQPTLEQVIATLDTFQGLQEQIPPMYSAKKVNGVKLANLARKGIEVERKPIKTRMAITFLNYEYPHLGKWSCSRCCSLYHV